MTKKTKDVKDIVYFTMSVEKKCLAYIREQAYKQDTTKQSIIRNLIRDYVEKGLLEKKRKKIEVQL